MAQKRLRQYRGEREPRDRDQERRADHGDDRGGEGREDLARRVRGAEDDPRHAGAGVTAPTRLPGSPGIHRNGPGSEPDYSAASASDTACCTVRPERSHSIGLPRSSVSRRASATPRAVTVCSLRNTSIKATIPWRAASTSA